MIEDTGTARDTLPSGSVESCRRDRKLARRTRAKLIRRLRSAVGANHHRRTRRLIVQILRSYHCKLVALDKANSRLKRDVRVSFEELKRRAGMLDPWTATGERVELRSQPKPRGGFRMIMSFGLENRALQILVREVLRVWALPKLLSQQHLLAGGHNHAVEAASHMIERGGHEHAVELDIQDCFGSIKGDWLKQKLPLPPEVIDNVCAASHLNLVALDITAHRHLNKSRNGIPQGSSVSSLIAEIAVASVLEHAPEGVEFQAYVDNVLCSAPNEQTAQSSQQTLERLFRAHPSGFFSVRSLGVRRLAEGVPFLGYVLSLERRRVSISVSHSKQDAFGARVEALWDRSDLDSTTRAAKADGLIRGWCAAHRLWGSVRVLEQHMREHIRYLIPPTVPGRLAPEENVEHNAMRSVGSDRFR